MNIQLLSIGKLKERYWQQACAEYAKRLQAYAKLKIVEIPEAKGASKDRILKKEGERLLTKLAKDTYLIVLAIDGQSFSSPAFAEHLQQLTTYGTSHLTFVIGGSYGLAKEVISRADLKLSFSNMTFPHQLMRVILLEQIYRACTINRGEVYHK